MPDEHSNTTTAIVAAVCSLVSGVAGAALAKLPEWLKYRRGQATDARKAKREDNDIVTENYATILSRLQEQCDALLRRSDEDRQKIDGLQASHLKCIEEHALAKGELRALMLHVGLQDTRPTQTPMQIGITVEQPKPPEAPS